MRNVLSDHEVEDAIWRGDDDALHLRSPCVCCCDEHTSSACPARRWHGCRGQATATLTAEEIEAWVAYYARHRGMSRVEFFGSPDEEPV